MIGLKFPNTSRDDMYSHVIGSSFLVDAATRRSSGTLHPSNLGLNRCKVYAVEEEHALATVPRASLTGEPILSTIPLQSLPLGRVRMTGVALLNDQCCGWCVEGETCVDSSPK